MSQQPESDPQSAGHLKSKGGLGRIFKAVKYAMRGLAAAWKHGLGFDASQLLFLLMVILGNSAGALIMNALVPQPTPKTT